MKCHDLDSLAIEYLDGALDTPARAPVEAHLAVCGDCAARLRGLAGVSQLLDSWQDIRPSASFDFRLQQKMNSPAASSTSWRDRLSLWWFFLPFSRPALAGAMLAVILSAVAVIQFYPGGIHSGWQATIVSSGTDSTLVAAGLADGNDELALYAELPVLENWELLSNFEVLQEMKGTTP